MKNVACFLYPSHYCRSIDGFGKTPGPCRPCRIDDGDLHCHTHCWESWGTDYIDLTGDVCKCSCPPPEPTTTDKPALPEKLP